VGVGLDHFKRADYAAAVDALERAQSLTSGFVEVHRYLAMAYLNRGQVSKARSQLAILEALNGDDPVLHAMSRKLRTPP
jgi:Flp pilus assembly protein TadD